MFGYQIVCLYDKVISRISSHFGSCDTDVIIILQRKIMVHTMHFESVSEGYRIEYGLKVMIAIRTFRQDVQSKIYLCAKLVF